MDIQSIFDRIPKRISDWSIEDVQTWLRAIHLEAYALVFKKHRIDGLALLELQQLQVKFKLGIGSRIVQKKIHRWVQFLRHNKVQLQRMYLQRQIYVKQQFQQEKKCCLGKSANRPFQKHKRQQTNVNCNKCWQKGRKRVQEISDKYAIQDQLDSYNDICQSYMNLDQSQSQTNRKPSNPNNRQVSESKRQVSKLNREIPHCKRELSLFKENASYIKREVSHNKREVSHKKREVSHNKREVSHKKREVSNSKREVSPSKREVSPSKREVSECPTAETMPFHCTLNHKDDILSVLNTSFSSFHQVLSIFQNKNQSKAAEKLMNQTLRFYLCLGHDFKIGSDPDCDLCCEGSDVAAVHGQIIHKGNEHFLREVAEYESEQQSGLAEYEDGKYSGLWVRVQGKVAIQQRMLIEMGSTEFYASQRDNWLYLKSFGKHGVLFSSFDGRQVQTVRVGRKLDNQMGFCEDKSMSSFHARFSYQGSGWFLTDMESTNGSWVRVKQQVQITDGLIFRVGKLEPSYFCRIERSTLLNKKNQISRQKARMIQQKAMVDKQKAMVDKQKARKSEQKDQKGGWCLKCGLYKMESVFRPCFHFYCCELCAAAVQVCDLCRVPVSQKLKIYTQ